MNRSPTPSYRLHKQSGQAIVTLADGVGRRHDVLLGVYNSSERRAEYARVIAEWEAMGRQFTSRRADPEQASLPMGELLLAYFQHVESY